MLKVDEDTCVGCGLCVTACPTEALKVWGHLEIDRQRCTDCLECVAFCPVDALGSVASSGQPPR